jgi:hypothetical protein
MIVDAHADRVRGARKIKYGVGTVAVNETLSWAAGSRPEISDYPALVVYTFDCGDRGAGRVNRGVGSVSFNEAVLKTTAVLVVSGDLATLVNSESIRIARPRKINSRVGSGTV